MMMANPRRNSYSSNTHHQITISDNTATTTTIPFQTQTLRTILTSLKFFLKKPHAFPFLLSIFLFLTWVSLRIQYHSAHNFSQSSSPSSHQKHKWSNSSVDEDHKANLVRFSSSAFPSLIAKDNRGWLLNPLSIGLHAGISGVAVTCASVHVGEIQPGGMRGNHRHHTSNETFVIWGATTVFRLENNAIGRGYAEVIVGADEVAVASSPSGIAHALVNVDLVRSTYFLGCQDSIINYNSSTSDFNIWKNL